MVSEATFRLLLASKMAGVGKKTLQSWAEDRLFYELPIEDWPLEFPLLKNLLLDQSILNKIKDEVKREVEECRKLNIKIIGLKDKEYPSLLKGTLDRPAILYLKGSVEALKTKSVAVIGTREPSEHGVITAERITSFFSQSGWVIVSGLALGVDTVSHQSALRSGGKTVAVMAHGLEKVYPKKNQRLAAQIVSEGGALVSEYALNTPSYKSNFVERDRIQAALSRGVVMVQSDEVGGSLHASRAILTYGRFLLVPIATRKDIATQHPKIRANLILSDGSSLEKMKILNCSESKLDFLEIIKSKEDYYCLEKKLLSLEM